MSREHKAVTNLRNYLQIRTVQPDPDYESCTKFLVTLGKSAGLDVEVKEIVSGKPIVLMTKLGTDPSLPSILLNSHTDVVPVFEERWKHAPFSGDKDSDGNIYGRGTQDMKGVGIMHLAAMEELRDVQLRRTVHLSFVPDEEIGGEEGMKLWVKSDHFKRLNIAFSLDESVVCPLDPYLVFHNERTIWTVKFIIRGQSGHGSTFLKETAGERLNRLLSIIYEYRKNEEAKCEKEPFNFGACATTMNLTMIEGGVQTNVLPEVIEAVFDCRVAPSVEHDDFDKWIKEVCRKVGDNVTAEYPARDPKGPTTPVDSTNPYWEAVKVAADKLNKKLMVVTCPGTTDSRYLRQVGVMALGLTAINNTPILLHDHNEYVNEDKLIDGIEFYKEVVKHVASV